MANRNYKYTVTVKFEKSRLECKKGQFRAPYPKGLNHMDTFTFNAKSLVLNASRTRKYLGGDILSNSNHTITKQLTKGLLCYYALAENFPRITKITIGLKHKYKEVFKSDVLYFQQPLRIKNNMPKSYLSAGFVLKDIFKDSEKAKAIRIAISYWLQGMSSLDAQYKFFHFWQAYNAIFRYQSKTKTDRKGLQDMRNFVLLEHLKFHNSINKAQELVMNQLLNKLRWSKFIVHDYSPSEGKKFHKFITNFSDKNIIQIFSRYYKAREQSLRNCGLLLDVQLHITSNCNTDKIIEIAILLCNNYAYFLRNSLFHGEFQDYSFKIIPDHIDEEFKILNSMLEQFLLYLIENHQILRQ